MADFRAACFLMRLAFMERVGGSRVESVAIFACFQQQGTHGVFATLELN